MDENEILLDEVEETETEETTENNEVLTEINNNLITINSNLTTTYNAINTLQAETLETQQILNNCFGGIQLISSLGLLLIIGAFIVLAIKYIRHFL